MIVRRDQQGKRKLAGMAALFNREHEPPDENDTDTAFDVAKTVTGAVIADAVVPGVGLAIATADLVIKHVFGSPFARRQQEWMSGMAAAIRRLENDRGIKPEELRDNPAFIDAAASAYAAFIKTSDERKRTALLNAVVNAALPSAPSEMDQHILIGLVDRLSPTHLAVVGFFRAPTKWRSPDGRSIGSFAHRVATPRDVLEEAFPELGGSGRPLADVIWGDLVGSGLVRNVPLDNSGEGPDGIVKKRVTEFGEKFVAFISNPIL
jgi:hypothetical protein